MYPWTLVIFGCIFTPSYSSTGCPSIDPKLLIRMLLVDYCYGVRSERRLCEDPHKHSQCSRPSLPVVPSVNTRLVQQNPLNS